MVITKAPLRISFAGGGTDLAAFYERDYGAVVSASIDKFVYIAMHPFFEKKLVLKYSKTEVAASIDEIQHPLIRECLRFAGCEDFIEVTSFADIPASGSGLGSSSAFCAALLKALHAHENRNIRHTDLAKMACQVEIDTLGEPIGKQDQYATACGGLNYIRFNKDGSVEVDPIILSKELRRELSSSLLLFYTGIHRRAGVILERQKNNTERNQDCFKYLCAMRELASSLREDLSHGRISAMGRILHEGWVLKRRMADGISFPAIDSYYERAIAAGAEGGKLLGAGGGGFLLFFCPSDRREQVIASLSDLQHVDFDLEPQGTRVIYYDE